ncbi:MAG TPA: tryptophan--tRNA ligase [Candidatus Paceibacterota bacterium]|jgi:tryptophanyl-tRNA synthetase
MTAKKRLLTGLQPSGQIHIGNYFAGIKPVVDLYHEYESILMVVDYHAMTTLRDPNQLRRNILDIVKDYVAAGIDPQSVLLFKQSDVPEHTELTWILDCLITVPMLMQGHAYKDKVANGKEATVGLFNYPVLMASDILLYDVDVVPVGEDNRQNIEYAREIVNKFNNAYGETFQMPKEIIPKEVGIVPGTDGRKMSKSYGNIIPAFGTREELQEAVMSIVTDSESVRPEHVYAIHKLVKSETELVSLYEANQGNYKILKEALVEDLETLIAPMREKRSHISDDDVRHILARGGEKARTIAAAKMKIVRERVGVSLAV